MTELRDVVDRVKSKNAGPFRLTIDLFFDGEDDYSTAKHSGAITAEAVSRIYGIPQEDVLGIYFVDFINAVKITVKRPVPQGHPDETDVFGMAQHGPILTLKL